MQLRQASAGTCPVDGNLSSRPITGCWLEWSLALFPQLGPTMLANPNTLSQAQPQDGSWEPQRLSPDCHQFLT